MRFLSEVAAVRQTRWWWGVLAMGQLLSQPYSCENSRKLIGSPSWVWTKFFLWSIRTPYGVKRSLCLSRKSDTRPSLLGNLWFFHKHGRNRCRSQNTETTTEHLQSPGVSHHLVTRNSKSRQLIICRFVYFSKWHNPPCDLASVSDSLATRFLWLLLCSGTSIILEWVAPEAFVTWEIVMSDCGMDTRTIRSP